MRLRIEIPENVNDIIQKLRQSGYQAYAVGGCIRDSLMSLLPDDWDICTSALPQQTLEVLQLPNIIENGMKHGTVTVRYHGENYEITTFRKDGQYTDHRRPSSVTFVNEIKEDLSRRDFTINALAYNEEEGLQDYFEGYQDIQRRILRCVGNPDERFQEDGLRIMRALRFAARFELTIEPLTAEAIHRNKALLKNISAERINTEFTKLLLSVGVEKILTEYADVIAEFIPEIKPMIGFEQKNPHHVYDVWSHTVKVVSFSPEDKVLRLAAFFHDIGKPYTFTKSEDGTGHFHGHPEVSAEMSSFIMKRLRYDNHTIAAVRNLVRVHDKRPPLEKKSVRRLLRDIGETMYLPLTELKRADAKAQNPDKLPEKLEYVDELERMLQEEIHSQSAYALRQLAVNGGDLKEAGITDGKEIGRMLQELLELVIEEKVPNERNALLKAIGL